MSAWICKSRGHVRVFQAQGKSQWEAVWMQPVLMRRKLAPSRVLCILTWKWWRNVIKNYQKKKKVAWRYVVCADNGSIRIKLLSFLHTKPSTIQSLVVIYFPFPCFAPSPFEGPHKEKVSSCIKTLCHGPVLNCLKAKKLLILCSPPPLFFFWRVRGVSQANLLLLLPPYAFSIKTQTK